MIGRTTGPALNLSWPEDFDVIGVTDDKTLAVMVAHDKNVENGHDDEGDDEDVDDTMTYEVINVHVMTHSSSRGVVLRSLVSTRSSQMTNEDT